MTTNNSRYFTLRSSTNLLTFFILTAFSLNCPAEHSLFTSLTGLGRLKSGTLGYSPTFDEVDRGTTNVSDRYLSDSSNSTVGGGANMESNARYGFLTALAVSSAKFNEAADPHAVEYWGHVWASFDDQLIIKLLNSSPPDIVHVRTTWSLSGDTIYTDPGNAVDLDNEYWGGSAGYAAVIQSMHYSGFIGRDNGEWRADEHSSPRVVSVTEELEWERSKLQLSSALNANTNTYSNSFYPTGDGYARSNASLRLLSIEILDPDTGQLVPVIVKASSGHTYPVVQPPPDGSDSGITAFTVNRETAEVFLSFASEEGANYCIQGSDNLTSWGDLEMLVGKERVSFVNTIDPPSKTSPSRFYRVVKVPN